MTTPPSIRWFYLTSLVLIVLAVCWATWLPHPDTAESSHTNGEPLAIQPLTAPSGFTAADENPDTAFREGEAGFSAYHRVGAPADGESELRLNVEDIADGLKAAPKDPEPELVRKAGKLKELGLNFGIVELPMYAALLGPTPIEKVTVYFDDQGWVVAYLPKGRASAAVWKYQSKGDTVTKEGLENNLLVLAINEVLKADGVAVISSGDVKYYDWENENCNAFVLFSAFANGGESAPVKFVVPSTITELGASAAVVLKRQINDGSPVTAEVLIDGVKVAEAGDGNLRDVQGFTLIRGDSGASLYKMTVKVPITDKAVGVVMLLYDKPGE